MTEEAPLSPLLTAAVVFDLDEVDRLVREGAREEAVFLGDHGQTLSEDDPDTAWILEELVASGRTVENETQALFELYETLLLAGHPVPDGSSRRCLIRVIAGSDPERHERAQRLMQLCNEQSMLTWQGSEWARRTVELMDGKPPIMKVMLPTPSSNDLFADAVGQAAAAGNLPLLDYLCTHIPPGIKGTHNPFVDISLPTHKAAASGHLECLQYLLSIMREDQWATSNPSTSRYSPLLCTAANANKLNVAEWLLDNGVNIDELAADGRNALSTSADGKAGPAMARLLLDRGINPNGGERGPKSLHLAIWHKTPGMVDLLLEGGVDPNYLDTGRSPLMLAAMMGAEDAVASLLAHGALIDQVDEQGMTPIAWACRNQREAAFMTLYKAGANMSIANNDGLTAFDHTQGSILAFLQQELIDSKAPMAPNSGRHRRF